MAHDVISLLLFIGVILLAFFRKVNVGVVALAVGAIAVRIFGLTDKQLIAGISASMFATLVGITLLFAAVTQTGALDLLARKIIALAGNRMWIIPIAVYIAGFIVAGVGPGAIPALAIIPAIAAVIAVEVGFDPIMLVLIGEAGLMAGRMTPITPEAAIITKLGLGYDELKEVNDQIIYAAVSGFGCYGPKYKRPGYDIIAQATSGLMSITGEAGGQPLRVGNAMGDVLGGMNLTIGILMALNARTVTGRGQRVDVSLVDSVVSSLEVGWQRFFASGKQPELIGNRYASAFPYDSFTASDGRFVIGCGNDKLFTLLCTKVLGREDLLTDPRFDTNIHRCENYAALKPEIEKWSIEHTIAECVSLIDAAGVPVAPINMLADVVNDEHIAGAREMFIHMHHPVIGDMTVPGNPVKLLDTKPDISKCAPDLGQDNKAVYGEMLGLTEGDLETLKAHNVI